jgi:Carboxypeptidase regulatory-like domain
VSLRTIRALGLGLLLSLSAMPLAAAPHSGKISGVVIDSTGTPQLGATVLISSEQLLGTAPDEFLTNDRGRFVTASLPTGMYSIKVTLAGFLPAVEQHILVDDQQTTLLQIVLGSIFSSFEKLRRQPDQAIAADEWDWVLRSSIATRAVLRWQGADDGINGQVNLAEAAPKPAVHGRLDLTSGTDRPGSVSNLADSPATAFAYDLGIGAHGRILMAGQFSYEGTSPAGGFATVWLPSGDPSDGPVTSIVVRESRLGPDGPTFRGVRFSHANQFVIGNRVGVHYGAEYLMAGFADTTSALRPRVEMTVQLTPDWLASVIVATTPTQDSPASENALQSAMNALDEFPTMLLRNGQPVLENGLHEEIAVGHALSKSSTLSAAVFQDHSTHTAVFGRGAGSGSDYLQDFFSNVFAYDAGHSSSMGVRFAYQQKFSDNLDTTFVYAYAGALAPLEDSPEVALRDQLATRYRHSLGARMTASVPHMRTKVMVSYKWIDGPAVSHQDPYGESHYYLDPYLSVEIRQPLPCHMQALADFGNLLAQGYVPIVTGDGGVVLISAYRYFRGGLSFQF